MKRRTSILVISVFIIIALSACNLPSSEPSETEEADPAALALTITALASGQGNSAAAPQNTVTPEFTGTPGPSATPSVPQVSVTTNTNCRIGPGVQYDLIDALLIGQTAEVVGKNSGVPNYWVIKRVNGSGTCWLWGQYATVTGNTSNLAEYPVPPTPTPSPTLTFTPTVTLTPTSPPSAPTAVNNVAVTKICAPLLPPLYQFGGTLTWEDKSNNEDGFNIYFNGGFFAAIPANSTSYPLPLLPFAAGSPQKWGVEAFNGVGKAAVKDVTFTCP